MTQNKWSSHDGTSEVTIGDCVQAMRGMDAGSVDVVFADPPYFLSGDGSTCSGGERVAVDKGEWDRPKTLREMHAWNGEWLREARRLLSPHGTMWVCGTSHNIHSVGLAMRQLGMDLINEIIWQKSNPPPNLACRCITHSHETILWAKRSPTSDHHFDYKASRTYSGKQMLDVWRLGPPGKNETVHGKHPTQKPIEVVERCLRVSAKPGGTVLDPFQGSGTTAVVAAMLGLRYRGVELDESWLAVTERRIADVGRVDEPDDDFRSVAPKRVKRVKLAARSI